MNAARPSVTRVLVVDDSKVVRQLVAAVIDRNPDLELIGSAGDGSEAVKEVSRLEPDVVILDLEMPKMDGLTALRQILRDAPDVRVVIHTNTAASDLPDITSLTESGRVQFVRKPSAISGVNDALAALANTLVPRLNSGFGPDRRKGAPAVRVPLQPATAKQIQAVVIGASTGGPVALDTILEGFKRPLKVPVFVVQHISADFSGRLVEGLGRRSDVAAVEAVSGGTARPGTINVAPGGVHLVLSGTRVAPLMVHSNTPPVNSCRPSVDELFTSAAKLFGPNVLGVVLTGMGQDGLEGCRTLAAGGAPILVQDEATSVVWGMPGAVADAGLADEVLPVSAIADRIERWIAVTNRSSRSTRRASSARPAGSAQSASGEPGS